MSTHAQAAKMIKQELKQLFPNAAMRVKSKSYAGGNSLTVYIGERIKTDEPSIYGDFKTVNSPELEAAKKLISKYEYGSFDGMTDCYNHKSDNIELPRVKYAFAEPYANAY